jgi:hypothetical protein
VVIALACFPGVTVPDFFCFVQGRYNLIGYKSNSFASLIMHQLMRRAGRQKDTPPQGKTGSLY